MYPPRIFYLLLSYDGCGAVWRSIIDDEQVEGLGECEYGVDHLSDVLSLVVGGYNDYAIAIHINIWGSTSC